MSEGTAYSPCRFVRDCSECMQPDAYCIFCFQSQNCISMQFCETWGTKTHVFAFYVHLHSSSAPCLNCYELCHNLSTIKLFGLNSVHICVFPIHFHEFRMITGFYNSPIFKHINSIGIPGC